MRLIFISSNTDTYTDNTYDLTAISYHSIDTTGRWIDAEEGYAMSLISIQVDQMAKDPLACHSILM